MKYILIIFIAIYSYGLDLKINHNYKQTIIKAKKENKKILMFIKSKYCPWCHKMEENTFKDKEIVKFINNNYIFLEIDKYNDLYPKKYSTDLIPTIHIVNANTQDTMYGYKTPNMFKEDLSLIGK
jgi:thioredoxin-related protein